MPFVKKTVQFKVKSKIETFAPAVSVFWTGYQCKN